MVQIHLVPHMIKHFLGHQFINKGKTDLRFTCLNCGFNVYIDAYSDKLLYYYVNYQAVIVSISCDEYIIKKLLE